MAAKDYQSVHSQPWLGRPFILNANSIAWGRYVITDSTLAGAPKEKRRRLKSIIKKADTSQLASVFEHLIHVYCPDTFENFFREIQALTTYHYAKEHRKVLLRDGCAPGDYHKANVAMVSAFDNALSVIFECSVPLHGLTGLTYVRYRQKLRDMHFTTFLDNKHTYKVAFTADLVLASIQLESD